MTILLTQEQIIRKLRGTGLFSQIRGALSSYLMDKKQQAEFLIYVKVSKNGEFATEIREGKYSNDINDISSESHKENLQCPK